MLSSRKTPAELPRQQEPVEKVTPWVFGSFRASCVGVRVCERGANINAEQTVGWGFGFEGWAWVDRARDQPHPHVVSCKRLQLELPLYRSGQPLLPRSRARGNVPLHYLDFSATNGALCYCREELATESFVLPPLEKCFIPIGVDFFN